MPRHLLDEAHMHPAIRCIVSELHRNTVDEVIRAVDHYPVVVVGMRHNPFCRKACKALQRAGIPFHYLEYGSYTGQWRRRLALKMWTGWPTFPMVFIKGQLTGGFGELEKLLAAGDLKELAPVR